MKTVPFAIRGVLLGLLATSASAQGPVLSTPGTATWTEELLTGGGTRTTFTITDNTVLDWDQFDLAAGSELVFDFLSGDSVVNNLNGTSRHKLYGDVTANGHVGFFSPNARFDVRGNVTANSVTIATLGVDATAFASGNYNLSGGGSTLRVSGSIEATTGDVVLASGGRMSIADTATLTANGQALIGAGSNVSVTSGGLERINVIGTIGQVVHNGTTTASGGAKIAAGENVTNNGEINVGTAQLFIEVGTGGRISNEASGLLVGNSTFKGAMVDNGVIIVPKEADVPPLVGESRLKVPSLRRPNGSSITTKKTVSYSAPMSATSDAGRASKPRNREVARVDSTKSLLKRSSFFGARGSRTVASR